MKLSCKQEDLSKGIAIVQKAVTGKSSLPILQNILLDAKDGKLMLSATNLEMFINYAIPAEIIEEGCTSLPGKTIGDFVASLPKGDVSLSLQKETEKTKISCSKSKANINGIDGNEFPVSKINDDENSFTVPYLVFKEAVGRVANCAAKQMTRPTLTGVSFSFEKSILTLVATDAFRLSKDEIQIENLEDRLNGLSFIVPAKSLGDVSRMFAGTGQDLRISFTEGSGCVVFCSGAIRASIQLIEGNFPNWSPIVPKNTGTVATISSSVLASACKTASVFARESTQSVKLSLSAKDETLSVSAVSAETGDNNTVVDVSVSEGDDAFVTLNVGYIIDILATMPESDLTMAIISASEPVVIKCKDGNEGFLSIIMPMKMGD